MEKYKCSYKIVSYIDPNIRVGEMVRLVDGSGLSLKSDDSITFPNKNYYIVDSYPEVTGIDKVLSKIDAKVVEIGINDYVVIGVSSVYVQDIIIQIGEAQFRTCSQFVRNIREKKLERILSE
jgi:hypothetical protein